jgi:hypothetical protein|tara:strand:+ start:139 stop:315 length:177 start_codon:yes stop_codon:yes gene_type:complete
VIAFISFTGGKTKSTYQRINALEFFINLQEIKPLISKFFEPGISKICDVSLFEAKKTK